MQDHLLEAIARGTTVVTASRRLARTLSREHAAIQQARGVMAWPSPAVLPWGGWLAQLWEQLLYASESPPVRLGLWPEVLLWRRVIRESTVASELLQIETTAAVAREAWSLAIEWRLDLERAESLATADALAFLGWARRFREICEDEGWLDEAQVPDWLARSLAKLELPPRVLLAGFDELTPQQRDLIAAAEAAGCCFDRVEQTAPHGDSQAVRTAFADSEQEMAAAARWARALLEDGSSKRIGVVVPDLAARRAMVESTFRAILEPARQLPGAGGPSSLINLSAGVALSRYPVIRSALALLSLSPDRNEWRRLSTLLLDPFLAGADSERTCRGQLDTRLRSGGEVQISMAELCRLCEDETSRCPSLKRALEAWLAIRQQAPAKRSAGQWCRTFAALLQAAGWPGERPLQSHEYQTVQAWTDLLSQLASTDRVAGDLALDEATSLLQSMAASTMFQPEGEDAPIQILGTLEAAGLTFDHLWIAGLDDEAWPPPARPNPFLPIRVQRQAGLPHCCAERELEFASAVTRRLLASASDLVVSYASRDQDRELSASPLLTSIPEVATGRLQLWSGLTYTEVIHRSRAVERLLDEQGPPLQAARWQRGGAKVFQCQAACPFQAFALLRLGAQALESPSPGLDLRQRGILVHLALEEFWREVKTHEALVTRSDIARVTEQSARSALARLERECGATLSRPFAALELRRLERLFAEWLLLESQRPPFAVVQPEAQRFAEVSGLRCQVKPDRIDRLPDGRELIVDYKTGSPRLADWSSARPAEPQLPLYATVHQAPLAGVLFGRVKAGEAQFRGLVDRDVELPGAEPVDLAAQINDWRVVLERLGAEFLAGHAAVSPRDGDATCRRCSLWCLCRIVEAGGRGDPEAVS